MIFFDVRSQLQEIKSIYNSRVEAAIDPSNAAIKDVLMRKINEDRVMLDGLRNKLEQFDQNHDADRERFLSFALDHAENMELYFLDLPKERLLQCKQMLFPSGFWVDAERKVYTPEISIIYRLAGSKKDTEVSQKATMVRVRRL